MSEPTFSDLAGSKDFWDWAVESGKIDIEHHPIGVLGDALRQYVHALEAKLEAIESAAFKLHEGVERFTVTNAELSDEMYTLRLAIGYDRMSQLRAAAQEKE